jgi:hypothetical protein
MVARVIRDLGIVETVDDMVKWDPKQCKHSPGTHVLAMLINILMGRTALYQVSRFYLPARCFTEKNLRRRPPEGAEYRAQRHAVKM